MRAIYVRTSVADADGAAQLHQLRLAAKARGWTDWKEYVDLGVSGAKASRPALNELRQAAKRGEVAEVLATELSRLARSLRDLILLLDDLGAGGCATITLREGIDLSTPSGRLMLHVLGAISEFEKSLITSRVKSGIQKCRDTGKTRSGKPLGRPRREVDLARVVDLRAKGLSWRAIAISMKTPRRTLERAFEAAAQNPPPKTKSARPRKRAA